MAALCKSACKYDDGSLAPPVQTCRGVPASRRGMAETVWLTPLSVMRFVELKLNHLVLRSAPDDDER